MDVDENERKEKRSKDREESNSVRTKEINLWYQTERERKKTEKE